MIIDNDSNVVIAIVNGRGTDGAYNRGFLVKRQLGSTTRLLIDYVPVFEAGYFYPSYATGDHEFDGDPENSGNEYYDSVTLHEALNCSLNTVTWQLLQEIGVKIGLSYLGKMEFSSPSRQDNTMTAISIDDFAYGTRIIGIAKGSSTFVDMGVYDDKTCPRSAVYDHTRQQVLPASSRRT